MPMNPNFLCCIGAELKNSTQQTTRMSQVYLYRAFEDDTLSDMLSAGFFNAAVGILRQDDLLLLYSPNETVAKWTYARVSNVDRDGITVAQIGIDATAVSVNTTGYSNLSGDNLQQIMNNLDTLLTTMNNAFVKKDGTSIMSAPLKFVGGSLRGAIGPTFGGVEFYTLNNDSPTYSLVALGRFSTNGFLPHNDNTYDIGSTARYWKDAYIARVITAVINNGYDIAVPVTNGPDTLALKSEVDTAANSGRMITDQGVWFAKMYAATIPPAADDGTNYADFSQTDGDGNPIIVIYERQSGAWVQSQTVTPPANYDGYVPVTKKIWDIVEQTGQNGGRILWNHQSKEFTPYPNIVSFENIEVTGESTVDMPLNPVPQQITNKDYVDSAVAASAATKANVDMDNLTSTGKNIANWSSNVSNCLIEIPNDIKLELNKSTGVVTLKGGSKTYIPNGANVFTELTITNDLTYGPEGSGTGYDFLYVRSDGSRLDFAFNNTSGTTAPTGSGFFWNTTTNKIKYYNNGTETNVQDSIPIAILHKTNGTWDSIENIFNGLGYMGSTAFVLPGVKGLMPNGRNADGTLNSVLFISQSVYTVTETGTNNYKFFLNNGSVGNSSVSAYDEIKNYNYNTSNNSIQNSVVIGSYKRTNGVISNFKQKQVFCALDYNDKQFISHQSAIGNNYINIATSLPASGTTFTAAADGYIVFSVNLEAAGRFFAIFNGNSNDTADLLDIAVASVNQNYVVKTPIAKGSVIKITYNGTPTLRSARLYYTQGEWLNA